jgi:hypothetical protein
VTKAPINDQIQTLSLQLLQIALCSLSQDNYSLMDAISRLPLAASTVDRLNNTLLNSLLTKYHPTIGHILCQKTTLDTDQIGYLLKMRL